MGFVSPHRLHLRHFVLYKLDISHSRWISGCLSKLLKQSWLRLPSLRTLILSDCELNLQDLCSLVKCKARGKLPQLLSLDISHNSRFHTIMNYFKHEKPSVDCIHHTKSVQQFSDNPTDSMNDSLQDLTISVNPGEKLVISRPWPRLERLAIVCIGETSIDSITKVNEGYCGGFGN